VSVCVEGQMGGGGRAPRTLFVCVSTRSGEVIEERGDRVEDGHGDTCAERGQRACWTSLDGGGHRRDGQLQTGAAYRDAHGRRRVVGDTESRFGAGVADAKGERRERTSDRSGRGFGFVGGRRGNGA
jgi:hypothetical protein